MRAYYNEIEPTAIAWLRELMRAGAIPDGHVDTRSIADVQPADLVGYDQCHFFAGIGGWPYALELAGLRDACGIWTGSCPCQPFSAAGKRRGTADERHLWPEFARLIGECRPAICLGEQVASKDGRQWLAGVRADLEAMGYAVGAADLCAAGVGAPHIRQRLYWCGKRLEHPTGEQMGVPGLTRVERDASGMAEPQCAGGESRRAPDKPGESAGAQGPWAPAKSGRRGYIGGGMGDANVTRPQGHRHPGERAGERAPWAASGTIPCADGKTRRISVEPGVFPLAHGVSGRVGLLRGYGNAIVPQVAAAFIDALELF